MGIPAAVVAVVLGVVPGIAGLAGGDSDPDADRPAVWQGRAAVAGVQVAFDPEPFLPVTDLVNLTAPEATSEWDPSRATARASPLWPGGFVTGFPNLLLPFILQREAPPYPGAAQAKFPDNVDAEVGGGLARAHAGRDFVESRASFQHPAVPSTQEGLIDVGSIATRTRQEWRDGALVTRAETLVTDITILSQIEIESVKAIAVATDDGAGGKSTKRSVNVGRVTIAGTPAVIDEGGISIAGQGDDGALLGAAGPAAEQAAGFLAEIGHDLDIRLVGSHEAVGAEGAQAQASGLLIRASFELTSPTGSPLPGDEVTAQLAGIVFDPLPDDLPKTVPPGPNVVFRRYFGTVTLGNAFASASVSGDAFKFGDLGDLVDLGPGVGSDGVPGLAGGGDGGGLGDRATPAGTGNRTTAPVSDGSATGTAGPIASGERAGAGDAATRPAVPAGGPRRFVDSFLLTERSADRVAVIYGVALAAIAVLFIGARFFIRRLLMERTLR